jgi:hypothetical protein
MLTQIFFRTNKWDVVAKISRKHNPSYKHPLLRREALTHTHSEWHLLHTYSIIWTCYNYKMEI